jgi:hypothetical protein
MTQATLALTYDSTLFSVSPSDIRLGSVPASGAGWTLDSTVDAAAGQIGLTIWSATPITSSAAGSLVTIVFHRTAAAASGAITIDVVPSVDPDGNGVISTQVDDVQGPYTLTPAPSDAYDPRIDGLVELATPDAPVTAVVRAVAAPVAPAIAVAAKVVAPVSAVVVSPQGGAPKEPPPVPQRAADGLFTALGRAAGTSEALIAAGGLGQALPDALAAQMSAGTSAQADLDRLLWDRGDSAWQDDNRPWLF